MNIRKTVVMLAVFRALSMGEQGVIDDFEEDNTTGGLNNTGMWYSMTDTVDSGKSRIHFGLSDTFAVTGEGYNSQGSLHFTYQLIQGGNEWSPYVETGVTLTHGTSADISGYEGLVYYYRGAGHAVRLHMDSVTDYAYHRMKLMPSDTWRRVEINIHEDLFQEWGEIKPIDLTQINTLSFIIEGSDGDSSFLEIDSIALLDTLEETKNNDMEVHPADPPTPKNLTAPGKVSNPLQDSAWKYIARGVNAADWLEADSFSSFDKYNGSILDSLAAQGVKSFRLPLDLDLYVQNRSEALAEGAEPMIDSTLYMIIDSFMEWTGENGMGLTIDYHQYDGSLNLESASDTHYRTLCSRVWKAVATHIGPGENPHVLLELTNEPGIFEAVPQSQWRSFAEEMIDSIRTADQQRPLIYGVSRWYDIDVLAASEPLADTGIIYSFHFYEPFIFSHLGTPWNGMGFTRNVPYPYSPERWSTEFSYFGIREDLLTAENRWILTQYKKYYQKGNPVDLRNQIVTAMNWAISHNVPIVCNEFGIYPQKTETADRVAYFNDVVGIFEEFRIPWQVWFGMRNNGDQGVIPEELRPLFSGKTSNLTESRSSVVQKRINYSQGVVTLPENQQIENISLYTTSGRRVWDKTLSKGVQNSVRLPVKDLAGGTYFLRAKNRYHTHTIRITQ
ncbi:MAG: cellulase family glycosylhydrolase [Fibrobacterota bacterium]